MKTKLYLLSLFLLFAGHLFAQGTIKGTVKDVTGEPILGAGVTVKGTTKGTITGIDGTYSISNVPEDAVLEFSFLGMKPQEIPVKGLTQIDVTLESDVQGLEEVVVIGYGAVKKRDLTGAVASVKSKDVVVAPTYNAMEAIQGKVAGVDITRSSGAAGAGTTIYVRGTRSIGDANDESTTNSMNKPLIIIDGIMGGKLEDLNSNDIESIDVLKDASSTAIYGYQGANGVILVTTKKGKAGKIKVSYNGYYGVNGLVQFPKAMLKDDYLKLRYEAYRNPVTNVIDSVGAFSDDERKAIQNGAWTDWVDIMLDNGVISDHQFSINGGTDKSRSIFSAGYYNEKGVVGDEFKRYTGRLNTEYEVSEWISSGLQIQAAYTDNDKRKDALGKALQASPFGKPYDEYGNINTYPMKDFGDIQTISPITDSRPYAYNNNEINSRIFSYGYVELKPISGLSLKSSLGLNVSNSKEGKFSDKYSSTPGNNTSTINNNNSRSLSFDNVATYSKSILEHNITGTLISSINKNISERSSLSTNNQLLPQQAFYGINSNTGSMSSGYSQTQSYSYAARLNYNYKGLYYLTASQRWDIASQLAKGHQLQTFPSVALAWRLSEESFMKNIELISNLNQVMRFV